MRSEVKSELIRELRNIYENKDCVCGVVSNAGYEHAWSRILDYIKTAKSLGEPLSSDNLLLLSLELRDEEEKQSNRHFKASVAML